jgi:hypothetical protein
MKFPTNLTEAELAVLREAGRIRARIRMERVTPERRLEIALKASAASVSSRRAAKEAKEKT